MNYRHTRVDIWLLNHHSDRVKGRGFLSVPGTGPLPVGDARREYSVTETGNTEGREASTHYNTPFPGAVEGADSSIRSHKPSLQMLAKASKVPKL